MYEHDPLTGLYNRSTFFSEAGKLMTNHPEIKFAMVRVDMIIPDIQLFLG